MADGLRRPAIFMAGRYPLSKKSLTMKQIRRVRHPQQNFMAPAMFVEKPGQCACERGDGRTAASGQAGAPPPRGLEAPAAIGD